MISQSLSLLLNLIPEPSVAKPEVAGVAPPNRSVAEATTVENAEAEDTLSNAERRQGALIARVEMRVAGTTRTVPRKIMTSPDEPGKHLLAQRNAQTGELEPLMRRDRVRPFGRDIDGVWREP